MPAGAALGAVNPAATVRTVRTRGPALLVVLVLAMLGCSSSGSKPEPSARLPPPGEGTPTFQVRVRLEGAGGGKAPAQGAISFLEAGKMNAKLTAPVAAPPDAWSTWAVFGTREADATRKSYPNTGLPEHLTVAYLGVDGITGLTRLSGEIRLDDGGDTIPITAELFGPRLGIMLWREAGIAHAGTEADYNRRYWTVIENAAIRAGSRPRQFTIVDGFVSASDDLRTWREGTAAVTGLGANTVSLINDPKLREALGADVKRTAGAVYCPPGYTFDYAPQAACGNGRAPDELDPWAAGLSTDLRAGARDARDVGALALSDEPAWRYPDAIDALKANPAAMARFREYLGRQGLTPQDVGQAGWEQVLPVDRSRATDAAGRRLFYWTMRFFPWDSARHFADATAALERAFYPGLPISVNWNNFAGPSYSPNPTASAPGAASGNHDWLEFGRMRGATALWTEDWFPDKDAYLWSDYASRLRSGAAKGGVGFGGYIIGRIGGDRPGGIVQKAMSLVGQGAKTLNFYTFGPEYNSPGNAYSERLLEKPALARDVAGANQMIGRAEDLLWPGTPVANRVALVYPRSSEMWDPQDPALSRSDVLMAYTVDYRAEVHALYQALQHAGVPVDWIEEEDLSADRLAAYDVVYLTAPNVPREGADALADWVRAGGALATVSGSGQRDRYDDLLPTLADASGIRDASRPPLVVPDLAGVAQAGSVLDAAGAEVPVYGVRGALADPQGTVEARFDDGSPAIVTNQVGAGRFFHFAFLPGTSYWRSATRPDDGLPFGFSDAVRDWIARPVELAGVKPPVEVDVPLIEAPVLSSPAGSAITLLNWTEGPVRTVDVRYRAPFPVAKVTSVEHGDLDFKTTSDGITFSVPLGAADVIRVYPGSGSGSGEPDDREL